MGDGQDVSSQSQIVEILSSPVFIILATIATLITLAWVGWAMIGALVTKPRVRLAFTRAQGKSGPVLQCDFYNDPLSQWPFSFLGIKRKGIDEFSAMASLVGVCELAVALHDRLGQHGDVFPLPASVYSLYWALVCFDDIGPFVINGEGVRTYLQPETYEIRILLHADEVDVRVMAHRFVVGVDASVFQWVGEPYKLSRTRLASCIQGLRRLLGGSAYP